MQPIDVEGFPNPYPDIVCTNDIVNGAPRLAGRLISVRDIVSAVYFCNDLAEVIISYCITVPKIKSALQYCSAQHCKNNKPGAFCETCSLRREQKGPLNIFGFKEITFDNTTYVRGEDSLFLGTLNELLEDWNGKDWWEIATDLLIDHRQELSEHNQA